MNRRVVLRLLGLTGAVLAGVPVGTVLAASADELAGQAQDALAVGDSEKALALLTQAQAKDPRNDRVQSLLGRTYFERGDARTALAHFSLAVRINPEDTLSRIMAETISQFPLPPAPPTVGENPPSKRVMPPPNDAARAERDALMASNGKQPPKPPLRLLLDPGHGGADHGAPGEGLRESDVALDIALRLARLLAASPEAVSLSLTRTADVSLPQWARASLAGFYGADLLLSLHATRVPRPEAGGVAVYAFSRTPSDPVAREVVRVEDGGRRPQPARADRTGQELFLKAARHAANAKRSASSDRLARNLLAGLHAANSPIPVNNVAGAGPFGLLAASDIPAVLVEAGFLSRPEDAAGLAVPEKRQALAQSLATVILRIAGETRPVARP